MVEISEHKKAESKKQKAEILAVLGALPQKEKSRQHS
jgi:hypothetical protein